MPMPHRTMMQVIKRRLVGKEGSEKIKELRAILDELPGYRSGPYADVRKWVMQQMDLTRIRSKAVHRDSIAIHREGAAQVALVGAPNAGKSSLLHALSDIQIKVGGYAFTTTRPVAAVTRIKGVLIQLVEIPGLLPGASEGRGGGRALLGVLREADAIVYCHDASAPFQKLEEIRNEVGLAGIDKPAILAVTKLDESDEDALQYARAAFPDMGAVGVSVIDDRDLEAFRDAVWNLTGLIRVYTRLGDETSETPFAFQEGATTRDVAAALHKQLAVEIKAAKVWGPSAKFPGQQVGADHELKDGDAVEIVA
ncbi:MAG TPA: GTPase [Actinomycetota bacterium]|nr:GTPase [Actinomycetota bacterium]